MERVVAERLDELERAVAEANASAAQRNVEVVGPLALRVEALDARLADEIGRLDELAALASRLDAVLDAAHTADLERREQIDAFRQQLADGLRLIEHVEPIRARCASLTQTTLQLQDELTAQRSSLTEGLAAVHDQLREVEDAMAGDAMAAISAHLDRVEELERAVAELDPDRFVTRSELQAHG